MRAVCPETGDTGVREDVFRGEPEDQSFGRRILSRFFELRGR